MADFPKKNVLLCLASQKGYEVLKVAQRYARDYQFCVSTFQETGLAESYDGRIRELAAEAGHRMVSIQEYRSRLAEVVQENSIQSILCVGWRYLVPAPIVALLGGNVVIAHDSLLPKLRGFAPLATAMIVGESETGVTYLRAGDAVDNGNILWQGRVAIGCDDTMQSMIEKLLPLYAQGAQRYFEDRLGVGTPQDETQATYSIWRDAADYQIDWTLDAEVIQRTIRALGTPLPGAQTTLAGQPVVLHRGTVQTELTFAIRQPGKIWSIDEAGRPTVVCGRGLLRIDEATLNGRNLIPCKSLRARFT